MCVCVCGGGGAMWGVCVRVCEFMWGVCEWERERGVCEYVRCEWHYWVLMWFRWHAAFIAAVELHLFINDYFQLSNSTLSKLLPSFLPPLYCYLILTPFYLFQQASCLRPKIKNTFGDHWISFCNKKTKARNMTIMFLLLLLPTEFVKLTKIK